MKQNIIIFWKKFQIKVKQGLSILFILKHVLVTCFEFHLEKLYLRFTKDTNENLWGRDGSVHITFHTFHTFRTLNCFYSFLTYAITILILNFVDIIFFWYFTPIGSWNVVCPVQTTFQPPNEFRRYFTHFMTSCFCT